jgi:5'(3')-deoxyribonucleotidase
MIIRNIFVDMDGVLADFDGGVQRWYNITFTEEEKNTWEYDYKAHGMTPQEFWSGLTTDFWANLEWTPEGKEIWAMVEDYKPIILTSPPFSGGGFNGKVEWIKRHLPEVRKDRRIIFTSYKHWNAAPGNILLDDKSDNVYDFRKAGGDAIMVPRSWNDLWMVSERGSGTIVRWVRYGLERFLG